MVHQDGGLPDPWDAFGDGTINPPNQPYTITTAIVLLGLLDALSLPDFWTEDEFKEIRNIVIRTSTYFCGQVFTKTENGGYFWYSTNPQDQRYFVPNVSSMMVGALSRVIYEQASFLQPKEFTFLKDCVNDAVKYIISICELRQNAPFFPYMIIPDIRKSFTIEESNDLVHHVYILYGLELYRSLIGNINIPWTTEQSLKSLDHFIKNNIVYDMPQDVVYIGEYEFYNTRPAILWGIGMMLAFYAMFDRNEQANFVLNIISEHYGPFPNLRLWPKYFSDDENFYARYAAHVLYGLAIKYFRRR